MKKLVVLMIVAFAMVGCGAVTGKVVAPKKVYSETEYGVCIDLKDYKKVHDDVVIDGNK